MEKNRVQSLKKSKGKFLSKLRSNNLDDTSNLNIEQKMERLIDQAELLAGFLLNKYQDNEKVRGRSSKKDRVRGSASKRNRGKKGRKKKIMQGESGSPFCLWFYRFKMPRESQV